MNKTIALLPVLILLLNACPTVIPDVDGDDGSGNIVVLQDQYEPTNNYATNAVPVFHFTNYNASLHDNTDIDWFYTTFAVWESYHIYSSDHISNTPQADTFITAYEGIWWDTVILSNDNDGAGNYSDFIITNFHTRDPYGIEVKMSPLNSNGKGYYSFNVDYIESWDFAVTPGFTNTNFVFMDYPGDVDYYSFTGNSGNTYNITAEAVNMGGGINIDLYLRLYDGTFTLLTNVDGPTNHAFLEFSPGTTSTYYCEVRDTNHSQGGYNISIVQN